MTDDERILALWQSVVDAVNASPLPLGVKALVLENTLFKVETALHCQAAPTEEESA